MKNIRVLSSLQPKVFQRLSADDISHRCQRKSKWVRALRGYFGPPMRSKTKSCPSQVSLY